METIGTIGGLGSRNQWAVVGGGFLGMTMALRLAQQGKRVTLYESATQLGGVASAWQLGDIVWDRHYHVFLQSDLHLLRLLRELDLERDLRWTVTRTAFYTDGRFYPFSSTLDFLRFPPLNAVDKARLGATILAASRIKDWGALESVPVAEWLARWSGRRVVEKIWLPLLRAKLGENYRDTSAAFIWATIQRMYAARRAGMKRELFGYVSGGYRRIIERFAEVLEQAGVRLHTGDKVEAIFSEGAGVRIETASHRAGRFDGAVVTAAAPVAARLCPQLPAAETERIREIRYQGIVCASLLLKRRLSEAYITNITDPRAPFTAVIDMSALVDPLELSGHGLVYLPLYLPAESASLDLPDDEIRARFLHGLEQMYPQFRAEDVLAFRVSRVKHLLPLPTLRYSERVPSLSDLVPNVHMVNSAHIVNGTLNVNETVQLAELHSARLGGRDAKDLASPPGAASERTETVAHA